MKCISDRAIRHAGSMTPDISVHIMNEGQNGWYLSIGRMVIGEDGYGRMEYEHYGHDRYDPKSRPATRDEAIEHLKRMI